MPSAVSLVVKDVAVPTVPSDIQPSSSSSVLPTVDEADPLTDTSNTNEVCGSVALPVPSTNDENGSVASSKQKRQFTSKNTTDTSSSARETREAKHRIMAEDEGTVNKQ